MSLEWTGGVTLRASGPCFRLYEHGRDPTQGPYPRGWEGGGHGGTAGPRELGHTGVRGGLWVGEEAVSRDKEGAPHLRTWKSNGG